jgi:cephalosporin-C deacetylase-like acetyl esterase
MTMLRRDFLASALAPRVDYRDYSRVLPDYLRALAAEAYRKRNAALAAVATADDARRRQAWARETFWRLSGGPLERTPLNIRTTGVFERGAYKVEKLIYESRPGFPVPANLYIPKKGSAPYPAVLFQMGHTLNGKAAALYQYCCQGLAQLGFIVLAFDPMGQGERTYYPRPNANTTRLASADDEHTVPGRQLILTGDTSTRFQVWDAVRSLDVLASHPMVDAKRLASTGNSGGGTLTMLLAAVDDRLACAAPACGNTENLACANFNPPGSTDDAEQDFLASGPEGFDRWDTLYPFAPKPLLLINSAKDFFGTYSPRYIENGREELGKLARVYRILDKPENLAWHESPLPHGLSLDIRLEIYRWFRRHLQGIETPLVEEPPVKAEPDATLYATRTGNVVRDLDSKTPFILARERAAAITTPAIPRNLGKLLALDPVPHPSLIIKGETRSQHAHIFAVEVPSAPGVFVPAWIFYPFTPRGDAPQLILLEPGGRNGRWNEDALCQQLASRGITVIAPDLRGIGDLRPEYPRHAPGHARSHQEEEAYAWASMMLGKPLLGQRVTDLIAVVRSIQGRGPIRVAASGPLTVPATFAAAIEPAIQILHLSGGIESFRSLLATEDYRHPFSNFVNDVLRHTDLPQLLASIAGRRVIVEKERRWDLDFLAQL